MATVENDIDQRDARRRYWRLITITGGCRMCRHYPVDAQTRRLRAVDLEDIQAHHILAQEDLKREGFRDWRKLYDERNGLGLCSYHHHRHEWAIQRVPRELLPNEVFDFASELDEILGLEVFALTLDRDYP